jgi:hypothetical protein
MKNDFLANRLKLPLILFASILLLALYLRLLVVSGSQVDIPLRADAGQYFSYAYNLKFHGVYAATDTWRSGATPVADNFRNPGYSLLLVPLLDAQVTAKNIYLITLMQAIISTFTVALVFFTIRRLFNFYTAAGAALLTAISPHLLNANVYVLTESVAAFSLVLFLWLYARSTTHADLPPSIDISRYTLTPPDSGKKQFRLGCSWGWLLLQEHLFVRRCNGFCCLCWELFTHFRRQTNAALAENYLVIARFYRFNVTVVGQKFPAIL